MRQGHLVVGFGGVRRIQTTDYRTIQETELEALVLGSGVWERRDSMKDVFLDMVE